jgi:hypothetical protein
MDRRPGTPTTLTLSTDYATHSLRAGQLEEITNLLVQARGIDEEEKKQIVAELRAGNQYLNAPKMRSDLVEELMLRPLRGLVKVAPTKRLVSSASDYLGWLLGALASPPQPAERPAS